MENLNSMIEHEKNYNRFSKIAEYLMNEIILYVNDIEFRLTELEFYFKSETHQDSDIHGSSEQKKSNTFYVHEKGRGGIDITFGNKEKNEYGGILIRGIKQIKGKKENVYIDGPVVVYKYLKNLMFPNENNIQRNQVREHINNCIRIETIAHNLKEDLLFQSSRVGLVSCNNKYKSYPYRYITDINSDHKFKEKTKVYCFTQKLNPEKTEFILGKISYQFNFDKNCKDLDFSFKQ